MKSAKELYEKHAGEYFYYCGEKVRLVGYSLHHNDSVIVVSGYSEGILKNNLVKNGRQIVDETLFDENEWIWYVRIYNIEFIKQ